ncbi:transposase [Veronia pacifica]|uniref:Transposase IS204/IS1001/IS1096/IS1165 DDE domain-containing protein n=1 Tax=Veronia pacifica TaxID=1080227 RepID=A0A1C3EAM8_9GAMM|nr:hypothetical protein A8L45_20530 [Veronia pacifica]
MIDIKPLLVAVMAVKEHFPAILNAMRLKVSNGLAEDINAKIHNMKLRAKGLRNKERFKTAILFCFVQLNMSFHHDRWRAADIHASQFIQYMSYFPFL